MPSWHESIANASANRGYSIVTPALSRGPASLAEALLLFGRLTACLAEEESGPRLKAGVTVGED
jgi:hypothetical protein